MYCIMLQRIAIMQFQEDTKLFSRWDCLFYLQSSWPSENQSVHVDESSSPDTDLLSLNNSATSSQTSSSSSSPPYEKRGITMATSPNKHNPNTTSGLSSVQTKKKQKKNDKGFLKKSFQYFNAEQLQTTRGDKMELDEDKSEESENTPPRGGYIPASPSRKPSNMKLLGERNNQVLKILLFDELHSHDHYHHQCLQEPFSPLCRVGPCPMIRLFSMLSCQLGQKQSNIKTLFCLLRNVSPHVLRGFPTWFPPR